MPVNPRSASPRWAVARPARPAAAVRLFCFPYAGGGSSLFTSWSRFLPETIEVCPVLLPGREERFGEPPRTRVEDLVPQLAENLAGWFDKPFAFFGHSMGGEIAFSLAQHLCEGGAALPVHVFVSGCVPHPSPVLRHTLPDGELLAEIRKMNGAPPEFLENPELIELLLPMLRADFALAENCVPAPEAVIPVDVTAFAGSADPEATHRQVQDWAEHVSGRFTSHELTGDHFFLREAAPLLEIVGRTLGRTVTGR
ncbi:thioesterase II family protein [Streptomyces sp. NPDC101227]|uniref:thioesterase II family protein n=1 Tax=Streptomyces sp. NPDC101227 TaxID=3366136 RepID=UPI0037F618DF